MTQPVTAAEHKFCETAVHMHEEFCSSDTLTDIILRLAYMSTYVLCITDYASIKARNAVAIIIHYYFDISCLRCMIVVPPSVPIVTTCRAKPPLAHANCG